MPREDGQANLVLHRQDASDEHGRTADDLAKERLQAEERTQPVDRTSHHARHRINLLAEYQRNLQKR